MCKGDMNLSEDNGQEKGKNLAKWEYGLIRVWPYAKDQNFSTYCNYRFRCYNYRIHCDHCKYAMDNYYEPMTKDQTFAKLKLEGTKFRSW